MSTETSHPTNTSSPTATEAPAPEQERNDIREQRPTPGRSARVARSRLGSRLGSIWVSLIGMALAFTALLIFVLQNPARIDLHFLWLDGRVPLGVAMLFAAIAGILLIAIPGTGRILQLRRRARRHRDG